MVERQPSRGVVRLRLSREEATSLRGLLDREVQRLGDDTSVAARRRCDRWSAIRRKVAAALRPEATEGLLVVGPWR